MASDILDEMEKIRKNGIRLTVGVNANGSREGGQEFHINDDSSDGCSDSTMIY